MEEKAATYQQKGAAGLDLQKGEEKEENGYFWSSDARFAGKRGTPEPVACEYCGRLRYTRGFRLAGHVVWSVLGPEPCGCPRAAAEYQKRLADQEAERAAEKRAEAEKKARELVQRIVGESGIGARFRSRCFDNFKITEDNRKALEAAKRYAEGFDRLLPQREGPPPGRNGLFISGPPGTGKTHLAVAIANQLMAGGKAVICMTMIDLLERIRRTFHVRDGQKGDEGEVLRVYKTVPLLVIDDMGKEPPTDWAMSTVYNIINGRYEACLPVIVTTNYGTKGLIARMTPRDTRDDTTARATLDRLMEMCGSITLTGESWRRMQ